MVARRVDRVMQELFAERAHHGGDERGVDLVELEPLHEHAARVEVRPDAAVELAREKARHAAHPGVRRLGHDDVIAPRVRGEEAFRVVDHDRAARVGEGAAVARCETARCLGHRRLDLDGVDALDVEALQHGVHGEPRADADHGDRPRVGLERERQRAGQHHGDLVRAAG